MNEYKLNVILKIINTQFQYKNYLGMRRKKKGNYYIPFMAITVTNIRISKEEWNQILFIINLG